MKRYEWKADGGANYSIVSESLETLTKLTATSIDTLPGATQSILAQIETDTGKYQLYQDKAGYVWWNQITPETEDAPPQFITCSVHKFIDLINKADKMLRFSATA